MRYFFHVRHGDIMHTDPTETQSFTDGVLIDGDKHLLEEQLTVVDSSIDDAKDKKDLDKRVSDRTAEILDRLSELDKEVPRIVEDMLDFSAFDGFTIYQSKQDIIDEKGTLRTELSGL